jgi:hypothetical protein
VVVGPTLLKGLGPASAAALAASAGGLRHHDAHRLGQHYQEKDGRRGETERAGGLVLALRHRLDGAAHDLGDEGREIDRQSSPQRRELGRDLGAPDDIEADQRRELDVLDLGREQPDRGERQQQGLRAQASALQRQPPDERR